MDILIFGPKGLQSLGDRALDKNDLVIIGEMKGYVESADPLVFKPLSNEAWEKATEEFTRGWNLLVGGEKEPSIIHILMEARKLYLSRRGPRKSLASNLVSYYVKRRAVGSILKRFGL